MHNVMHSDIVTLMIVDTDDSRILAEAPLLRDAETGLTAMIGQVRGTISMVALTHRGSKTYEFAKALAGEPMKVTGVFMPWDEPQGA